MDYRQRKAEATLKALRDTVEHFKLGLPADIWDRVVLYTSEDIQGQLVEAMVYAGDLPGWRTLITDNKLLGHTVYSVGGNDHLAIGLKID